MNHVQERITISFCWGQLSICWTYDCIQTALWLFHMLPHGEEHFIVFMTVHIWSFVIDGRTLLKETENPPLQEEGPGSYNLLCERRLMTGEDSVSSNRNGT